MVIELNETEQHTGETLIHRCSRRRSSKLMIGDAFKEWEIRVVEDRVCSLINKHDLCLFFSTPDVHADNAEEHTNQSEINQVLGNQACVSSILSTLPRVDTNDDSLKDLIASLRGHAEQHKKDDNKPPNDKC
ncbi:hypothetical protein MKW98_029147 [Papaver atlanticum]|uniref:Uncharacterized protein n=1 Tax=Papaver atlanticum TaxID=357466 RepID=A0AAD4SA30_9MAGN|nr:hypothetical protein MKW98_029147 [Papaver atlanticum]